ncbi:hypothetical protein PEX1_021620 [Penicillium expansum]|uniref:Zn(2)-C6 fungal-type domain-containing protein n=1 Tax=Penicillium expansum TaxID=27334 RepID=A0A0A2IBH7_PENEN|nr:hypothetical protein PEX2_081310 [Penicillium expansum]KGO39788.1 hypothetical protein PEXP_032030 [Penicillium expansum]KGO48243.1 hypothetical protein PEX1_021620 [Penicillium expansum]KGO61277.1 hypothetical protein PEX2_081310 [Penicillium expansum]
MDMDMDMDYDTIAESEAKRRKIRKGTKSCWECKKRKMKCVYADHPSPADAEAICIGCQRRGSKCVSQEFEFYDERENAGHLERKGRHRTSGKDEDRVARVEALVEQLIKKVDRHGGVAVPATSEIPTPSYGILTPDAASIDKESSRFLSVCKPSDDHGSAEAEGRYENLSQRLHDSLPSRQVIEMICNACGRKAILFYEMLNTPYAVLEQNGLKSPDSLLEIPSPSSHPVLIARHMLYLATFLQHLHPNSLGAINGLPESLHALIERLAGTAINFVTTNDEFFGSIEGLECVMMESMYYQDGGNLRRSWIANRRAMAIAQMMNLHQNQSRAKYKVLDHKTKAHPQFMWFRIVSLDRNLCLMLGLTQGSFDQSMATGTAFRDDIPMGRLERMHCTLASRILERNESDQSDPSADDFALTQNLDLELQKAGRTMPSKWWLMPNLDNVTDDPRALFLDMGRLFNQLYHYNLLNQLHLPYMLRSSPERKYEYSRMTCVNASREVLLRFIMFRSYNRNNFCCRTVDFFALMAAITLLLAHLNSHRFSQASNPLGHQYLGDRAMIEQAQVNMEEISRVNGDTLSAQSADLLHKLLAVDSETADGISTESVSVQTPESAVFQPSENDNSVVRVQIPYFGIVRIARQGVVSRETANAQPLLNNGQPYAPVINMHHTESSEAAVRDLGSGRFDENAFPSSMTEADYNSVHSVNGPPAQLTSRYQDAVSDTLLQNYQDPGLTAGVHDWAFQGVDMAFFDSIMRGIDNGNSSENWDNGP